MFEVAGSILCIKEDHNVQETQGTDRLKKIARAAKFEPTGFVAKLFIPWQDQIA